MMLENFSDIASYFHLSESDSLNETNHAFKKTRKWKQKQEKALEI